MKSVITLPGSGRRTPWHRSVAKRFRALGNTILSPFAPRIPPTRPPTIFFPTPQRNGTANDSVTIIGEARNQRNQSQQTEPDSTETDETDRTSTETDSSVVQEQDAENDGPPAANLRPRPRVDYRPFF